LSLSHVLNWSIGLVNHLIRLPPASSTPMKSAISVPRSSQTSEENGCPSGRDLARVENARSMKRNSDRSGQVLEAEAKSPFFRTYGVEAVHADY
jgi:hypothetical protein